MPAVGTAEIKLTTNADAVIDTCRVIAKHLTALADELELSKRSDEIERDL